MSNEFLLCIKIINTSIVLLKCISLKKKKIYQYRITQISEILSKRIIMLIGMKKDKIKC